VVTYLDFITPFVASQSPADAIYFDLNMLSALSLIPCFFRSLALLGFLVVMQTSFIVTEPSTYNLRFMFLVTYRDLFQGLCFSTYSLMPCGVHFNYSRSLLLLITSKSSMPLNLLLTAIY
jgi:hypothetical protein